MTQRHVVLMRQSGVADHVVAVADAGEMTSEQVGLAATIAREEGFDLLFEFRAPFDIRSAIAKLGEGKPLSSMGGLVKLWDLRSDSSR